MIIDALVNMDFYKNLNESLYKGLRFLRETDLAVDELERKWNPCHKIYFHVFSSKEQFASNTWIGYLSPNHPND